MSREEIRSASSSASDSKDKPRSLALVLEWENAETLEIDEALGFLRDLKQRAKSFRDRFPRSRIGITIVFGEDVADEVVEQVYAICAEVFSPADIVFLLTRGVPYYNKKSVAAFHTEFDVLVYCDSDCSYDEDWLEEISRPIFDGEVALVSGRTFAQIGDSWKERASALAWFFPVRDAGDPLEERRREVFIANNFAVARETIVQYPIPIHHGSRSHGGLWLRVLKDHGKKILFLQGACAVHKQYEALSPLFARAWLLGKDTNIARNLGPRGRLSRKQLILRARNSAVERFTVLRRRIASPAMARLARSSGERWAIIIVAYLFQAVVSASQFWYAMTDHAPNVRFDYSDFLETTRPIR